MILQINHTEIQKLWPMVIRIVLITGILSLRFKNFWKILTGTDIIFIGPNSLSRAEDLAAVNHVTQTVVRVGS